MYTQLSSTQQAALDTGECPHCHTQGTVRKEWTRNGPTVVCSQCRKKVYRPRGRAVAQGTGTVTGTSGGTEGGVAAAGSDGGESEPQDSKSSSPLPSQASQAASQKIGKPLSDAARDAISKIEQALRETMQKALDAERKKMSDEMQKRQSEIDQEIAEQVEQLKPQEIIVKPSDASQPSVTIKGAHKLLGEVLRRINAGIRNFLFVGPSGSGKSTLARQLAEALNVPYGMLPWSGDTTPGTVLGRPSPDGKTFFPSVWMETYYQAHSVFNHDELDGADPNVPICMNSAIENGVVFLPSGAIHRHVDHVVVATANTWGIGADMLYCGRNQLDAAVRDRFVGGMMFVDYDADLETQLVPEKTFREQFWQVRGKIFEHRLRRIWGTRALLRGALLLRGGYQQQEVFTALTVGFSPDELQKIGL